MFQKHCLFHKTNARPCTHTPNSAEPTLYLLATPWVCPEAQLHMDCPPKFGELLFDIGEREFQCRPPVRTRRALRKNTFALKLQCLKLAFTFGCRGMSSSDLCGTF